jgi:hypothetical protein
MHGFSCNFGFLHYRKTKVIIMEVMQMGRCKLCGAEDKEEELTGPYCLRCDKIVADAYADMGTEF